LNRLRQRATLTPIHFPPSEGTLPFKSQAQRRKFAELLVKGEISPDTFEEWNRETGGRKLPERVKPKPARKRKRVMKRKRVVKRKTAVKRKRAVK
jgi:hypothetical protein